MIYIFDIDGTLTPSRNPINPDFKNIFESWIKGKRVWLITGSDRPKTVEQLGENLLSKFERVYQCAGNVLYKGSDLIYEKEFYLPVEVEEYLNGVLESSPYPIKTGRHFEQRKGSVNFSTIGRNCTQEERDNYYEWDKVNKERATIVKNFNDRFKELNISVGGQISMDILPAENDKGQIVKDIDGPFTFFGDHLFPGGNDFPMIREALLQDKFNDSKFYKTQDWIHTALLLTKIND